MSVSLTPVIFYEIISLKKTPCRISITSSYLWFRSDRLRFPIPYQCRECAISLPPLYMISAIDTRNNLWIVVVVVVVHIIKLFRSS